MHTAKYTAKDFRIIAGLRQNARIPLTDLSKKLGIPITTIFDRLRMQKKSLIVKHVTLIDYNELGFNARANIFFKLGKHCKEEFKDCMVRNCFVNSLYKVNNGYDFMAECIFRSVKDMEEFLEDLSEKFVIRNKDVHHIINDIKREDFIANPECVSVLGFT